MREVLRRAGVRPEAIAVTAHTQEGYTTNIALEDLLDEDVLLAIKHDGRDLPAEHHRDWTPGRLSSAGFVPRAVRANYREMFVMIRERRLEGRPRRQNWAAASARVARRSSNTSGITSS